jgi:CHASE3 domain sensor protein
MGVVVTTAANAPGDNRLQQANELKRVVADTQALQNIVEAARDTNKAKFDEARTTMAAVREDMLALGIKLNPGATVAAQTY